MLFIIAIGYSTDRNSKLVSNTVMKRGQIMNIGLREAKRKMHLEQPSVLKVKSLGMKISTREMKKMRRDNGEEDEKVEIKVTKDVTFLSRYMHALKNSHNLFEIFSKYNPAFPRPYRALIYFLRFYGMLAISSLFFTQTHVILSKGNLSSSQIT